MPFAPLPQTEIPTTCANDKNDTLVAKKWLEYRVTDCLGYWQIEKVTTRGHHYKKKLH